MKNISMMQLVLAVTGAALIYSGIKNVDLPKFLSTVVRDPKQAFSGSYAIDANGSGAAQPSVNTNPKPSTGSGGIPA